MVKAIALSRKNVWERSPRMVRTALGPLLRLLPARVVLGASFIRAMQLLEAAERWEPQRIHEFQTARLRELCSAAMRTPYWREVFRERGLSASTITLEQLKQLPLLNRETVRARTMDMCTRPPSHPSVDFVSTSGSTGAPVGLYIGADRSAVEYAYTVSSWSRVGFHHGDTLAVFRGKPVDRDARGLRHTYDPLLGAHAYSVYHMSEPNMTRYLDHIASIGPCFLHGYPSTVYALGRHLNQLGRPVPANIRGLLLESETLYPTQRVFLESVFGRRCFSSYGQTEKVVSAAECEHSPDYHVWPTYGICELVDSAGRTIVTPGRRGEIVGTSFLNTVMPFIRYRTGDFATLAGFSCAACGRHHMRLTNLRGHRSQELLVTTDGSTVPWTAVNMHDDTFMHVLRFQFYQDTPGSALLRLVPSTSFGEVDRERIARRLRRKLAGRLSIVIELVDDLPRAPNGKAVYVDQRLRHLEPVDDDADDCGPSAAAVSY